MSALALSWAVKVIQGHTGSAMKCSCSSLTALAALCIVFVGVPRSGECLADVGRRNCSALFLERWLTLGPLGSAAPSLSNPGALASSPGARGSNTWHRTVKTHLVTERRTDWEPVIQFTSKKGGQKSSLLWVLGRMCSLSSFFVSYLHLSMFMNVSYLLTIHEQHIFHAYSAWDGVSCVCFLENQSAKTWKCGDKVGKQHAVIQERINRKQHGLRHWAASWKD